ncbi:hypothetical protein [Pseudomonas sp.]|uniref:hypothetical protein n=1 Tax=Pseudomonas sp. TaxID=306 RepID=UPI003981C8D5
MAQALSFSVSKLDCASIRNTQSFPLSLELLASKVSITSLTGLSEIEYLIFCTEHIPFWVAKVHEFVLVPGQRDKVIAKLATMRDVWGSARSVAGEHNFDSSPTRNASLSAEFFSSGEPVEFSVNLDLPASLSLSNATELLAETYRVHASKVKIAISN